MKAVLLFILLFTVALVYGCRRRPCQRNPDNNAYNKFLQTSVVHGCFNRWSKCQWRRFLISKRLCNRAWQSFIEGRDLGRVVNICNGHGRPVNGGHPGDLCISNSSMVVYDVRLSRCGYCRVASVVRRVTPAVVACDTVGRSCVPVRLVRYTNQCPNWRARPCRPRC